MKQTRKEKINQEIHEKVFGKCWHFFYSSEQQMPHQRLDHCAKCEDFFGDYKARQEKQFNYFENIEDAFLIVEHFRAHWLKKNSEETNFFEIIDCCQHGWRVDIKFGHHDGDADLFTISDKSLPRAICLAGLWAIENT